MPTGIQKEGKTKAKPDIADGNSAHRRSKKGSRRSSDGNGSASVVNMAAMIAVAVAILSVYFGSFGNLMHAVGIGGKISSAPGQDLKSEHDTSEDQFKTEVSEDVESLHKAAAAGKLEQIRQLVEVQGLEVDALNGDGATALMSASQMGRLKVIDYMLAKGANPSAREPRIGLTCLRLAASRGHSKTVKRLLEVGVDVNEADLHGITPLHVAALGGHKKVIAVLMNHGADASLKDSLVKVNATMMAFANNQDEAGKYIEQLVLVRLGRALPV